MGSVVEDELKRERVLEGDDLKIEGREKRIGKIKKSEIKRVRERIIGKRIGNWLRKGGKCNRWIVLK